VSITCKEIDRIETVDVNRHAWIEASAGTGKTHTLSHLAIRLLKERADLDIGNILLVTFTEKAAGELKERVRQQIAATAEELAHDDPSAARRFFSMMAAFDDEAAIYTIHGFCHHLLTDYAFETGALFSSEMVADPPLVAPLLKREMLETWPLRYGRYLPEMMRLAGFARGKGGVEAKISAILQKTPRPDRGDRLLPQIDQEYHDLRDQLTATAKQLDILLNGSPSFVEQYEQLHIRKNSKQANIKNILDPLALWSQSPDPVDLTAITQYDKIKKEGAEALTPEWLKAGDNSATACPTLLRVKDHLDRLLVLHEQMTHYLVVTSIEPLQQRIQAAKAREGLFSYDDLIGQVHEALFGDNGLLFLEAIRDRFEVALVDEFQDTDPLQWRIFRKLFLQGPSQRLILIGDPKQAIYGFRGADLYTYLAAKKELTRLAQKKRAVLYTLSVNYRSSRRLIAACNRLFGRLEWFGDSNQTGDGIFYKEVRHDPQGKYDEEARAFHLIDLRPVERPIEAYAALAEFIAREIRILVSQASMTVYQGESRPSRPIQWNDVAILIRRKKGPETLFIERALSDNAIPFSHYKKPGLFQSKEAYFLATVLQAVATPHDRGAVRRAFLTPFFALTPNEVVDPRFGDIMEKARLHLMDWVALARKRQWGALFEALLTTSGFTYRSAQKNLWERQITNYKQLIEQLTKEALGSNLGLERLLVWFDQMRIRGAQSGKEEAVHRIETELPKVQIMTVHASKGLEFPIVFVAGGLTQGRAAAIKTFHQMEGFESRQVIDVTGKGNPGRVKKELLNEEKNLYYVAMTRARQRLYFPFWKGRKRAGPVGGFIAAAIENAFSRCNCDVAWRHLDEIVATTPLPGLNETTLKHPKPALPPQPLFHDNSTYFNRVTRLASFSSLQQKRSSRGPAPQSFRWDLSFKEDDEPSQWVVSPMTTDGLPGGKTMGSCLHLLLETIDYAHVISSQESLAPGKPCGRVVDQAMAAFGIDPKWREAVVGIIWSTLTTPLKVGDSRITLGALPQKDRLHETAFMFTIAEKEAIAQTRGLRGAIDLVFRYRNRYYVVDFKSNRLADYGPETLEASIAKDGYERQYKIYAVAIYRWLAQLNPGRSAQFELGGVFYLYLRGLTKAGSTGIYFVPPERLGGPEKIEKQVWLWFNREPFNDA